MLWRRLQHKSLACLDQHAVPLLAVAAARVASRRAVASATVAIVTAFAASCGSRTASKPDLLAAFPAARPVGLRPLHS